MRTVRQECGCGQQQYPNILSQSWKVVIKGRHCLGRLVRDNDELLVSWGVDGRVCPRISRSVDEFKRHCLGAQEDYPIYALNVYHAQERDNSTCLAVGAGGDW
jgi:hypothetical protein